MNKFLLSFILISGLAIFVGAQVRISGTVQGGPEDKPLYGVQVTLDQTGETVESDRIGYFQFVDVAPGDYTLSFDFESYESTTINLQVGNDNVDVGTISLTYNPINETIGLVTLSVDELASEDVASQSNTGLLQASRDVFVSTAAFEFGAYFYDIRGYDNRYNDVLFNGVRMNKIDNGRVDFSNWGGLNDITRYPEEVIIGLEQSAYTFGDVGGVTSINTRPSGLRKGTSLAYSLTNRSYRQRVLATYNSGLNKNGWGFTVSGARRWAEEGLVEGTFYDSWAYYLAIEKKFNDKHTVFFTGFGAPNRRATNSPNTQEVYDLRDDVGYNAYWGYQDGEKRSERIRRTHEPVLMLTHDWDISDKTELMTTVAYQFGKNGGTRLDWYNAQNPSPIYYQNFPSWARYQALRGDGVIDDFEQANIQNVENAWRNDPSFYQLDWNRLYTQNRNSSQGNSVFYLVDDINEDRTISVYSKLETTLADDLNLSLIGSYQQTNSELYREVDDLLGGQFVFDNDDFFDPEQFPGATSNSFNNNAGNDRALEGDKIQYHYELDVTDADFTAIVNHQIGDLDLTFTGKVGYNSFQRNGFFDHYAYDDSFGKSEKFDFIDFGGKLNALYKIDGRNFFRLDGAYFTNAPTANQVFPNARETNSSIPDLETSKILSGDLNFIHRSPNFKARATVFFTEFRDEIDNFFGFIDRTYTSTAANGLPNLNDSQNVLENSGLEDRFAGIVLKGVDRRHIGAELALEYKLLTSLTARAVVAAGNYHYTSNPELLLYSVDYAANSNNAQEGNFESFGEVSYKDYKVGNTPQTAVSLGLEYRSPDYWWVGISGNYLGNNYVNITPSRRTQEFVTNPLSPNAGNVYPGVTEDRLRQLLEQEQFSDEIAMNLNAGKTMRFGDYYMGISLNVTNVLNNENIRTGGFEQARTGNFPDLDDENRAQAFGNRYWYNQGIGYFLNVFFRF